MTVAQDIAPLVARASGAVSATVFSRNAHGPYTRPRTIPFDPNTALQVVVRDAMILLTARWRDVLTEAQRKAWDLYALNVLLPNRLGRVTNVSGLAMYVRSNAPRLQTGAAALPLQDTAPSLFNLPSFTPITRVVLNIIDDTVHPFFAPADAWANVVGAGLIFWISAPKPLTVNFHRGPYRFAGTILGAVGSSPTSPGTLNLPIPAAAGQRVFVRYRLTELDGRLSNDYRLPADIVPQVRPLPLTVTAPNFPLFFTTFTTFDQLIKPEALDVANWSLRLANRRWIPTNRTTFGSAIIMRWSRTIIDAGPDILDYAGAPRTVHGLLTGLDVLPFFNFPVT